MKVKAVQCKLINRTRHTYIDHRAVRQLRLWKAPTFHSRYRAPCSMIKFKQTPINRQNVIRNSLTTANPV